MSAVTALQELTAVLAFLPAEDMMKINAAIHARPELQTWLNVAASERHQILANRASQPGGHRLPRVG